jgi:type VI secretion system protein ImpB
MAKKDSVQKRLERVRPPRVQLTYDVEIGDAVEQKELPFVMGVMGDFT